MFSNLDEQMQWAFRKVVVLFGKEILDVVPGRVSTEVNPGFSYDTEKSINEVLKVMELYQEVGIEKERILFKICSTWEGMKAAKILENQHGLHCNMTLIFSKYQAIAAAESCATLVSPFVGRIYDYYKSKDPNYNKEGVNDEGVISVTEIFYYFKKHNIKTQVMGASFRNVKQIIALNGCDLLTISPNLMEELTEMKNPDTTIYLDDTQVKEMDIPKVTINEKSFSDNVYNHDMAGFKLKEGIDKFIQDAEKLSEMLRNLLIK
ncbi:hypothetical protein A3Q56_05541 [Intoshia linei]|uniref:Uncharacterized protein n=1 Tax=Intoshia linei TaxID=1819745 RepID=A0A177AXK8_9BILA|nr:hypothetical protein A3Q56_05541 [Intoshia linei]